MTQSIGNMNSFNVLLAKGTCYSEIEEERGHEMEELSTNSDCTFGIFVFFFHLYLPIFGYLKLGLRTSPQKLDLKIIQPY